MESTRAQSLFALLFSVGLSGLMALLTICGAYNAHMYFFSLVFSNELQTYILVSSSVSPHGYLLGISNLPCSRLNSWFYSENCFSCRIPISFNSNLIPPIAYTRNLGVILDFSLYPTSVCHQILMALLNISRIHPLLTSFTAITTIQVTVIFHSVIRWTSTVVSLLQLLPPCNLFLMQKLNQFS